MSYDVLLATMRERRPRSIGKHPSEPSQPIRGSGGPVGRQKKGGSPCLSEESSDSAHERVPCRAESQVAKKGPLSRLGGGHPVPPAKSDRPDKGVTLSPAGVPWGSPCPSDKSAGGHPVPPINQLGVTLSHCMNPINPKTSFWSRDRQAGPERVPCRQESVSSVRLPYSSPQDPPKSRRSPLLAPKKGHPVPYHLLPPPAAPPPPTNPTPCPGEDPFSGLLTLGLLPLAPFPSGPG